MADDDNEPKDTPKESIRSPPVNGEKSAEASQMEVDEEKRSTGDAKTETKKESAGTPAGAEAPAAAAGAADEDDAVEY